ncbi:MAG TPA: hypothetical protein VKE22_10830 [Haliangiales bacterium]|nr:hypothetical protein [Haliangiales bacterium]
MRVGLLDIAAAGALAAALLLPAPTREIVPLFRNDTSLAAPLAEAQADALRAPHDGRAAARLADLLVRARETDWAIAAATTAAREPFPGRWRAMVAASAAFTDRIELAPAYAWADQALKACDEPGSDCAEMERTRLDMYVTALRAAVESGIDPAKNPKGFEDVVRKAVPLIRLGKPK